MTGTAGCKLNREQAVPLSSDVDDNIKVKLGIWENVLISQAAGPAN